MRENHWLECDLGSLAGAIPALVLCIKIAQDKERRYRLGIHLHSLLEGSFRSITWGTTGTASIVREPHGRLAVRLSKNFLTHRAPELYVYLVKLHGQERVEWKQVGTLKQFWGGQSYAMPKLTASDLTAQVAIYCAKCNKFNGLAQLAPAS